MATIANKFLYFSTVAAYNAAKTDIANGSIVFVNQEAGENVEAQRFIVTHGKEFHANLAADSIKTAIEALDVTNLTNSDATDRGVTITLNEVDGKVTSITISDLAGAKLGTYTKGSDDSAIASGDTIAAALAKLENQIANKIDALDSDISAGADKYFTGIELKDGKLVGTSVSGSKTTTANVDSAKVVDYQAVNESTAQTISTSDTIAGAIAKVQKNVEVEAAARQAAIEALDYTIPAGSHTEGKAVTAVSESDGVIAVTEGNIKADYVTYTPQVTSEQGAAETTYDTANTNVQAVLKEIFEKIADNAAAGEFEVYQGSIAAGNEVNSIAADGQDYIFAQGGVAVATMNIAKDLFLKSGEVVYGSYDSSTHTFTPASAAADQSNAYIKLVINNDSGDATDSIIYIPAAALVTEYSANNASGAKVTISVSNHQISAAVTAGSIEKTDLVTTLQNEITSARTTITPVASGTGVHVTVTKTAGSGATADNYVIAENDIASASDLTAEVTRAKSAETAIDGAIGLTKGVSDETRTYTNTGNYIGKGSTNTVTSDIKALDTQAKANADAAAEAKTVVNEKSTGHVTVSVDSTAADGHAEVTISEDDIASAALVGTLPSGITATTVVGYAAEIASDEADAAETAAKSYADAITVNSKGKANNSQNILIDGSDIALTGYTAKSGAGNGDVADTDTVNAAIKKVETKVDNLDTASPFEYSNSSNKATVLKGSNLTAQNASEVAVGQYNVSTSGKTQFSVGIGAANAQKNGIEVQNDGTIIIYPYTSSGTFSTTAAILQEILHNEIDWYEG